MNYFLHYKFLFIFSFLCIVSSVLYILVNLLISYDDNLLFEEPYSNEFPRSLNMFKFQKIICWREIPNPMQYDIFNPWVTSKPEIEEKKEHVCSNFSETLNSEKPFLINLDGWSGLEDKMVFVFSDVNSNKTFVGSIGDSFNNPDFTIMSVDFKTIQDDWHLYSIPIVTILDKERGRLITLAPDSGRHNLHAIN